MRNTSTIAVCGILLFVAACSDSTSAKEDTDATSDLGGSDLGSDLGGSDLGSDTGTRDMGGDTGENGPISTAGVLCDVNESGDQQLVYAHVNPPTGASTPVDEVLGYNYAWTCDTEGRTITGNGVPNHAVTNGEFATKVSAQSVSQTFPIEPARTSAITQVKEPGYALNSVKFDPATAGTCPDDATDDADCNYARGTDSWQMVATPGDVSPWKFGFGVDENDAHVQPNGQYHYHGTPVQLIESLNPDNETSMTLVGWAVDGFPIYTVQGYADASDSTSDIFEVRSSYQTVETVPANRPSVDDFPLGHFMADWEYVEGSGDLDECNGRFGVTPEFPEGVYHYHLTNTYPFVHRCVKGTSTATGPGRP